MNTEPHPNWTHSDSDDAIVHHNPSKWAILTERRQILRSMGCILGTSMMPWLAGCTHHEMAPKTELKLLQGINFSTSSWVGKNVGLVNFWATSCVTCIQEMPDMIKTYQRYADKGFDLLAIAMKYDRPDYIQRYAQSRQLPFKVGQDVDGHLAKAWYDVRLTPTSFLLNKKGEIIETYHGQPHFETLHTLIEQALAD